MSIDKLVVEAPFEGLSLKDIFIGKFVPTVWLCTSSVPGKDNYKLIQFENDWVCICTYLWYRLKIYVPGRWHFHRLRHSWCLSVSLCTPQRKKKCRRYITLHTIIKLHEVTNYFILLFESLLDRLILTTVRNTILTRVERRIAIDNAGY